MYPFRADVRVVFPRGEIVPRVDIGGIYVLATTGKVYNTEEETSLDYGINPCQWMALPNEGVMIWKVRHPVTSNEASAAVNVVIPSSTRSTVSSPNTTNGTSKVPVVDNKGTQTVGSDVTNPVSSGDGSPIGSYTEHWVYFNKEAGIFRLMGVKSQNSPSSANTPAVEPSAKSK